MTDRQTDRRTDRQTDRQTDGHPGKTICLPTLKGGDIIKTLGHDMVSDKKIFHVFHYISLCKKCDARGGATFGPRGII